MRLGRASAPLYRNILPLCSVTSNNVTRSLSTSTSSTLTLGIRREDPSRIWERRVPLIPEAVQSLISEEGIRVLIQPCSRRVFPTEEYLKVGAQVSESLEEANIVIGIKETPLKELLTSPVNGRSRTHIMFSHTAKGQLYNMPLLSRFTNSTARLVDYELLTNTDGKRVVAFGWYAGAAGVPEALSALALEHLHRGVSSPFLLLPRPYNHRGLEDLRKSLRDIGSIIKEFGTPPATGPYIIALTGNGNVSQGALNLLHELPLKHMPAKDLKALATNPDTPRSVVYLVHVKPEDYLIDVRGRPYDRSTYYSKPELFNSLFYERVAPYISLLINGAGWKPGFPRLMSNLQLANAQQIARRISPFRFTSIADISCDIEGGLEFVSKAATISEPFFTARPANHPEDLPGIQVMSVDILPSEIPLDSSRHFSTKLLPYLRSFIRKEGGRKLESHDLENLDAFKRGTMVENGKLEPPHAWLKDQLTVIRTPSEAVVTTSADPASPSGTIRKKRVLLLGSGMVAKPAVDYIASRKDIDLVIASNNLTEGRALAKSHDNVSAALLDIADTSALNAIIEQADLVISLLPMPLHADVAKHCIAHRKHMVTASYISPQMKELHQNAQDADVLLLNEIGLDPGIDHCSAVDLCERIGSQGREITSFISTCGGLPVPEDSNVPLAYKFSWSPRGVLTAALNGAKYRLGGKNVEIAPGGILSSGFRDFPLVPGLALECLPNRDSLSYGPIYGLNAVDKLESMFRGTLRYKGFSSMMQCFLSSGVLDATALLNLNSQGGWYSFLSQALSKACGRPVKNSSGDIIAVLRDRGVSEEKLGEFLEAAEWLSMTKPSKSVSDTQLDLSLPSVPPEPTPALDLFARLLVHKLRYLPGEKDSVILSHEIISRPLNPSSSSTSTTDNTDASSDMMQQQIHTSTLIVRQSDSFSSSTAMAVTVSLPLAIAALRVLDGHVQIRGVVGPTASSEIYRPVLKELEELGVVMKEETKWRTGTNRGLAHRMMVGSGH
ncbi:hypothetical protein FRC17_001423 [Serendipita sp. 399]|nr:hypothetical protein FRC17_001423 [Serendipita sp. 399]